jgi:PTEN phosphatase family protein
MFHGSVGRYSIDDHNVPTLEQMLEFVKDVRDFLAQDEKNVIAVHCKGGKGRTGTMICAWLIFNGQFSDSKDVLDHFGKQRTDKTIGNKYQGVETPSQARYVEYFNKVINEMNGVIPAKQTLNLKSIKITQLIGIGAGTGLDLTCSIYIDRDMTFGADFGQQTNCMAEYLPEADVLKVNLINCPQLVGNVRIKFNCKTRSVPNAYEKCAFYFWFNTSFVDLNSSGTLKIVRDDLDNPHKAKTWKLYRDKFAVELTFN